MTEKQIENIKKKIRSLRAKLSAEKRKFGSYDDSYGRRYVIAELYIKISDYKAALRYFNWFENEFPDDAGFPDFLLYWTATLFENNKLAQTKRLAYRTLFSNIYLIDLLCGNQPGYTDFKGYSNIDKLEFALTINEACLKVISDNFLSWLKDFCNTEDYKRVLKEYVSLDKLIQDENPGDVRSQLLKAKWDLQKRYTND